MILSLRSILLLSVILVSCLFLFGCINNTITNNGYSQEYLNNLNRTALFDSNTIGNCTLGSCWCMTCQNGSSFFGYFSSMIGGRCSFDKACTPERFGSIINQSFNTSISVRSFMIGQGPTFADFGAATPYCNDRLSMSVMWLLGSDNRSYQRPDSSAAMCELRQGVMPLYILYSGDKNINETRSREIGGILATQGRYIQGGRLSSGPVGPVIVTTEIDFNRSDVDLIKRQITALYEGCGNTQLDHRCLIAVAPKINDYASLDAVLSDSSINNKVDLVAFGINSNYIDVGNSCTTPSGDVMQQTINFASYSLYNWSKPSVIPYIMIDAKGHDSDNSCNWSESSMIDTFSTLMQMGVVSLPQKGVIGMAPYQFNNTLAGMVNPLNCGDCSLGKNDARLRSWFGGCQVYTAMASRTSSGALRPFGTAGRPIVFGNTSATYCEAGTDISSQFSGLSFGTGSDRDFLSPQPAAYNGNVNQSILTCDSCISTQFGPAPFDFGSGGADLTLGCNAYPEIERFASMRGLDPNLIRAFIQGESSFNKCDAARVCRHGYSGVGPDGRGCFDSDNSSDDECYGKALNEITDPDYENGVPPASGSSTMNPSLSCTFANDNTNNPPNWRWCAFGLMQVTDPPYTYWPASLSPTGVDGTHWATTQELLSRPVSQVTMGGMAASKAACGDHFNPFNITDNLCWGTAKLSANLDQGRAAVDHYRDQGLIDWPADTLEGAEKDRVFAAYIAANKYSGTWDQHFISSSVCGTMTDGDCLMKLYHDRRIVTPDFCTPSRGGVLITPDCFANGIPRDEAHGGCYGYQDPVRLMTCLLHLYGAPHYQWDRGAGKMARYYYFRNNCANSNCPATRQLLVATGHSDLTNSGTFNPQDSIDGSTLPPPSGH